jgi:ABC-type sugar transport system substrate-binding protein
VALVGAILAGCSGTSPTAAPASDTPAATTAATEAPAATEAAVTPEAELLNIWYVNPLPSFEAWGMSSQIFADNAEAGGYKATLVGPDKIDIPAMVSMIEQAIADGADGIITCSLDPAAFKDVIDKAQAAGIVVVSIGCVDENADYSVGTDNTEYGKVSADLIAASKSPAAQVGILGTARETPNQVAQVDGFNAQIAAQYPDMKVLTWETDNSDPAVASQKISAMLAAYPEMDTLWYIEGAAAGVTPSALQEAGKEPGDVFVLAIDALQPTLAAIEDGWISKTLTQCWFWASPFAADLIKAKQAGNGPDQQFWPVAVDPVDASRLPYQGCPAELIPTLP